MYSPGRPYIVVAPVVTSWAVAGQRMVFFHMFLQARVTLEAFPIVAPRGRSVSFPTRGTMVTYVTWDDLYITLKAEYKNFPLMYGLLGYDNIWLRYNYLKIWNLRVQENQNIEKKLHLKLSKWSP